MFLTSSGINDSKCDKAARGYKLLHCRLKSTSLDTLERFSYDVYCENPKFELFKKACKKLKKKRKHKISPIKILTLSNAWFLAVGNKYKYVKDCDFEISMNTDDSSSSKTGSAMGFLKRAKNAIVPDRYKKRISICEYSVRIAALEYRAVEKLQESCELEWKEGENMEKFMWDLLNYECRPKDNISSIPTGQKCQESGFISDKECLEEMCPTKAKKYRFSYKPKEYVVSNDNMGPASDIRKGEDTEANLKYECQSCTSDTGCTSCCFFELSAEDDDSEKSFKEKWNKMVQSVKEFVHKSRYLATLYEKDITNVDREMQNGRKHEVLKGLNEMLEDPKVFENDSVKGQMEEIVREMATAATFYFQQ
eukprot:g5863.t1